jgi:predicted phage terminase large subunit-like protein
VTTPDTLAAILRSDLGTFVAKVFNTVSPGDLYLHNWHIDAIVFELMRIHRSENRRLIINQPPRSLKSICTSVAYVAWALGHQPERRFACVSYSAELTATFARQFRVVVNSDWYRALFPGMRLAKDTESECVTTGGGGRIGVSVGGSFTGRGADVILIDDPLKAEDSQSESARRAVNDWFGTTLLSRLNDKEAGAIVLVMQRLHEDDLAGKLLREGVWQHLNLPAIADEDQVVAIGPRRTHLRRLGEALHPERESLTVLDAIKREMGSLAFSAQYLQRPVPLEGNLIRRKWVKWFDQAPDLGMGTEVVQSWDIASTITDTSDWSVCTTWLKAGRNYYILDVWRDRLEFPALTKKVIVLAQEYKPNRILIEKVGPGLHLIQELRANPVAGVPLPIGIQPEGEKFLRMEAQAARFESGQVHLPRNAPWLSDLLQELLAFPNSRNDDQVDSVSQFLNWAESTHLWRATVSLCGPIIITA